MANHKIGYVLGGISLVVFVVWGVSGFNNGNACDTPSSSSIPNLPPLRELQFLSPFRSTFEKLGTKFQIL